MHKALYLSTQARDPAIHYQHSAIGYNYRLSNILAGIGRAQLDVLDERVKARREIFARYKKSLANIAGITFMPELKDTMGNRWMTALTIDDKITGVRYSDVINALEEEILNQGLSGNHYIYNPSLKMQHFFQKAAIKAFQLCYLNKVYVYHPVPA